MPTKDFYHDTVVIALQKEGWQITHDPYTIKIGRTRVHIDLGAEKSVIGAEKGGKKIAIEIKSFIGRSDLDQFEDAFGQYLIYHKALRTREPDRQLFLAVPLGFYGRFFDQDFFADLVVEFKVKLIVFEEATKHIVKWIS